MRYARARGSEPDARHRRLEFFAVFRLVDRFLRRPDQLDVVLVEHALAREVERAIERGLPAHRRQERVGPLALDDLGEHRPGDRLDVGDVGHLRIGHDRRRIRVDQDDLVALLAQRLARLRPRIVELAGLADDDRAGADDKDRFDVRSSWHFRKAPAFRIYLRFALSVSPSFAQTGRRGIPYRAAPGSLPGAPGSKTRACR